MRNNVIKFIEKFISNKLYFLNVGDIVLCKRYDNDYEKENIPIGHREGPYIIINKTLTKTYGIYCTSTLNELRFDNEYIEIKENYDLNKKTYINTNKIVVLNKDKYLKKLSELSNEQLNYIKKVLYVENYKRFKFKFDVGDIVIKNNNHLYYIYDVDDNNYYLFSIDKTKNSKNPVLINNIKYSFNFEGSSKINKKTKLKLIDTSNINDIILGKRDKYFKNKLLKDVVKRGDLVKYNNKLYYIYGEEKTDWLVYLVYEKKSKYQIKINNKIYYTDFISDNICMNKKLDILRSSKEDEMTYIRDLRKKNKLKIRKELKNISGKGFIHYNFNISLKIKYSNYLKKVDILIHL